MIGTIDPSFALPHPPSNKAQVENIPEIWSVELAKHVLHF